MIYDASIFSSIGLIERLGIVALVRVDLKLRCRLCKVVSATLKALVAAQPDGNWSWVRAVTAWDSVKPRSDGMIAMARFEVR